MHAPHHHKEKATTAVTVSASPSASIDWGMLTTPPQAAAATPRAAAAAAAAAAASVAPSSAITIHALLSEVHQLSMERVSAAQVAAALSAQVAALQANLSDSVRMQSAMQAKIQVLEYGLKIERRHNAMLMQQAAAMGAVSKNSTLLPIHSVHTGNGGAEAGAGGAASGAAGSSTTESGLSSPRRSSNYHTLPSSFPAPIAEPQIDPTMFQAYMAAISPRAGKNGALGVGGAESLTLPRSLPAPPATIHPNKHAMTMHAEAGAGAKANGATTPLSNATSALPHAANASDNGGTSGGLNYNYNRTGSSSQHTGETTAIHTSKPPSLSANTFMPPSEAEIEQEINAAKSPPAAHMGHGSNGGAPAGAGLSFNYASSDSSSSSGSGSTATKPDMDRSQTVFNYSTGSPLPASAGASADADVGSPKLGQTAFDMRNVGAALKMSAAASSPGGSADSGSDAASGSSSHTRTSSGSSHKRGASSLSSSSLAGGPFSSLAAAAGTSAKQWRPKLMLKSHMDAVRSVCFDRNRSASSGSGSGPPPTLLLSGSEDGTAQLWNLATALTTPSTPASRKAGGAPQPLPLHTYRGHRGMVTAVHLQSALGAFSAGVDGQVVHWALPTGAAAGSPVDLYASYGSCSVFARRRLAHADAVWSIDVLPAGADGADGAPSQPLLAAAVANGDIVLWGVDAAPEGSTELQGEQTPLRTIRVPLPGGADGACCIPTSVQFVPSSQGRVLAVGCSNGLLALVDVSSGAVQSVCAEAGDGVEASRIMQLIAHPTQPLLITAHLDHSVRFWDCEQSLRVALLPAHRGTVSCVALDGSGGSLVSGSHDESIRIWSTDERKIRQVLDTHQTHRLKFAEAIHSVSSHPVQPYLASAGADGIIKLYV